ncbi:hypothetical protein [Glaciibacter flavus]|uniref:hypothetical protein n=1 Tax=Orlajensenia flava TaxID=2565934 RepID=UPI003AFF75D6
MTQLVARPTALELRAADGSVVMSLDYMGSAADAVSTLSTVFGGAPVDKPYEGTNHVPPGINHVWDYMTLDERHYDEAMRQDKGINDIVWPRYAIYFDAPEVRGISLSTVQGFAAGDSWSTIQGGPGIGIVGCNGVSAETTVYPAVHEGRDVSVTAGVAFRLDDAQQSVRWIAAPEDFDPGCP